MEHTVSERRQLALLLAGLVLLTAVGFVGATLFPEACDDLEQVGQLDLRFADADDALHVDEQTGSALQALGEDAGIGPWKGAVPLPEGATVHRSEFGFFVVTADEFVVLRPSMGIASAPRGRAGLDVFPAGTSLALRAADGETGVYNGEYELDRCGELPADADVLAVDRGFAVVRDGAEVVLRTLSGDEVWRAPAVAGAHVTEDAVLLGQDGDVAQHDARTGAVVDRFADVPVPATVPWLEAVDDQLLLPAEAGLLPLLVEEEVLASSAVAPLPFVGPPLDAAVAPGGVVAIGASEGGATAIALTGAAATLLPEGVAATELHASQDGHVGLVVEVDGRRGLLVYGPFQVAFADG